MLDVVYNWQLWIVTLLLMTIIWIKVRAERYRGYREGIVKGFLSGVEFTVHVVADKNLIENPDDKNIPLTEEQLIRLLSPMLTTELLKHNNPKV